jgi:cysteinyl-tRNA synthetase
MPLQIYNTLSRRKEPFEPLQEGRVSMYVCGVTVYDECHIGHARSAIVFDVIYRYLTYLGYDVEYVRNFTDIDDKILERAKAEGIPWDQIASTYIEAFNRDMDALGVLTPTYEPLATEHIPLMIEVIEKLIEKGHAYAADGNVYFSVSSFPEYGKLSRIQRDQMLAGARVEPDEHKRDPLDFALWKRSQPGEPWWESPWGPGRPGWHIECTCMSQKYLGETLDIHGGGLDLVFPHHENEIAQAEALTGKPFVRYWIHNGPLNIEGVKMSKSLGNVLSIKDAVRMYHPEELRLCMLMTHYRSPLDFSSRGMSEVRAALERLYMTVGRIQEILSDPPSEGAEAEVISRGHEEVPGELSERIKGFPRQFRRAMDDDFNTPAALGHLFSLNRGLNRWMDESSFQATPKAKAVLREALNCYRIYEKVMGILNEDPQAFMRQKEDRFLREAGLTREEIEELIQRRAKARAERNWPEADRIRDMLQEKGIQLLDSREGTTWRIRPSP